ncbi:MAG TPA: GAF domain-containing protein [Rhodocyclaceae bacterium]|nr:GAF domain-containing protein [Rhodocyclaceae bacterium]
MSAADSAQRVPMAHTGRGEQDAGGGYKLQALHILSEVTASLAGDSDIEALLGRFLSTMIRLAGAQGGAVRLLTSDGAHLRLVGSLGLPADFAAREHLMPLDCGACGQAMRENRTSFSIDMHDCAKITGLPFFDSKCQAMVVVPLRYRGKLLGAYNLFLSERFELPEEVALLFRSIGEHLGMALENVRLTRENLRITLMNERQMMANEVHDSLAQSLAYMKMRMALLQDALADGQPERADKYAGDVSQALDDAYTGLRQLITQYRNRMDPLGLLHALAEMSSAFQERTGIALDYDNRIMDLNLSVDQEAQVFYIIQEALANVVRHSGASRAGLLLEQIADHYQVTVEDNGKGGQGFFVVANPIGSFDEHPRLRDHFGLAIMRERAQRLGGRIDVANLPAGGVRMRLSFPAPAIGEAP